MRIAIDLGGTKIEAIVLGDDGCVLLRRRTATPRDDYQETLSAIVTLLREIEREVACPGRVGVGIPGTISSETGLVKNANSTWPIGRPLADENGARARERDQPDRS